MLKIEVGHFQHGRGLQQDYVSAIEIWVYEAYWTVEG